MNRNTKRKLKKIITMINGWELGAPDATFAGMTLAEFKEAMQPALEEHERVNRLLTELQGARKELQLKSITSHAIALRVGSAVKADAQYGDNSSLYSNMGYVRKSDRKSGLTRKLHKTEEGAVVPMAE